MNGLSAASHGGLLEDLAVLGEATRARILLLLEHQEITVVELCRILQAPQSTISRHLKALADAGWLVSRAEGTSRLYGMARTSLQPAERRLWQLVRQDVSPTATAVQDARRLERVLAERRSRSQEFFQSSAVGWDTLRDQLFGRSLWAQALLGVVDEDWVVGDLGCGSGQLVAALVGRVRNVIGVDDSAAMLQAARRRLRGLGPVDLRRGRLESLPLDDAELDVAFCVLVLHHVPEPLAALREAARVLRPGGRLVVVDMLPHDREAYRAQMGHVWLGFSEEQSLALLAEAGFVACHWRASTPEPEANGPGLFVAAARRSSASATNRNLPMEEK